MSSKDVLRPDGMWLSTADSKTLVPEIARLKQEQQQLRDQRKKLAKELKNAEKKRSRLKKRAKQLTDSDLVAVMLLRASEKGAAKSARIDEKPEKCAAAETAADVSANAEAGHEST